MKGKFGTIHTKIGGYKTPGDIVSVKTMVEHPMDSGYRHDSHGRTIPRNIITDFRCYFEDKNILDIQLSAGVSKNPTFAFSFKATRPGRLTLWFTDDQGCSLKKTVSIGSA